MNHTITDQKYMEMALRKAREGAQSGEVPVGAVLVKGDQVLAHDYNQCIGRCDPTAHAEMLVLRKAGALLGNYRLKDAVLYVTAEPCPMCLSAMIHARISRLVFGTVEPKFGAVESKFRLLEQNGLNHHMEVTRGILEKECREVLRSFFKKKRVVDRNG